VRQCAPEHAPVGALAWQEMTPAEKAAVGERPWTLSGWLYYFGPAGEGMGGDRS